MTINEIITAYLQGKEQESTGKKQADAMKKLILQYAGTDDNFSTDVYTIVIKTTVSRRLDTEKIMHDFPDMKEVYGKDTESKQISAAMVTGAKKSA